MLLIFIATVKLCNGFMETAVGSPTGHSQNFFWRDPIGDKHRDRPQSKVNVIY